MPFDGSSLHLIRNQINTILVNVVVVIDIAEVYGVWPM